MYYKLIFITLFKHFRMLLALCHTPRLWNTTVKLSAERKISSQQILLIMYPLHRWQSSTK